MGALRKIMMSKEVSRVAKIKFYKTVIRPTVVYGSETWILTKKNESKLEAWERKMLRSILGGTKTVSGVWRQRTNREVAEIYGHSSIIQYVKAQRLRWLGHVWRMDEFRHSRRTLLEGEGGRRGRGRPRRKWMEAVTSDLRGLGVTDWRSSAQDRTAWRRLIDRIQEENF